MEAKKYVLIPGRVVSRVDGQVHRIGAYDLAKLYGVKRSECYVAEDERDLRVLPKDLVVLRPRSDGNYTLVK